ncbi:MAG: F0F1 ATP synthase subunit gamma [Gallionellaceae bacterium]|nr:F0F1 ATP synthase subunit gamma [Gallionellaceae bacterium]
MSGQAELAQRYARLKEISGIMTAMKSLSLVETKKLSRFIGHQRRMLANIEAAAADFLHFFPVAGEPGQQPAILLMIGSERGFCGNFNERVLAALAALPGWQPAPTLLVVGSRLAAKLESHPGTVARLDGPTVTEDVPAVLNRIMDALHAASRQLSGAGAALFSLAHEAEGEPSLKRLLPFDPAPAPHLAHPPRLQLAAPEFFAELLDQYLLATLYGLLYESLAAESRQRLAHMENALDRLDETIARLALKRNALRQEKIVEEIEVILSSEMAFHD